MEKKQLFNFGPEEEESTPGDVQEEAQGRSEAPAIDLDTLTRTELQELLAETENRIINLKEYIQEIRTAMLSNKAREALEKREARRLTGIKNFIAAHCLTRPGDWAPLSDLYEKYTAFMVSTWTVPSRENPGSRILTVRLFSKGLQELGYKRRKGRAAGFNGVFFEGIDINKRPVTEV